MAPQLRPPVRHEMPPPREHHLLRASDRSFKHYTHLYEPLRNSMRRVQRPRHRCVSTLRPDPTPSPLPRTPEPLDDTMQINRAAVPVRLWPYTAAPLSKAVSAVNSSFPAATNASPSAADAPARKRRAETRQSSGCTRNACRGAGGTIRLARTCSLPCHRAEKCPPCTQSW